MTRHNKKNLVSEIIKKVAHRIGAKILLDPEYEFAGMIEYESGIHRFFRATSLDLNHLGASKIAKDKDYSNFFLSAGGYPVIEGKTFFSDDFCRELSSDRNIHAAYAYAKKIGFPVFVKPNGGSRGKAVAKVSNKKDFYEAMREAFKEDRVALVQRTVSGKDYRVVVLDGKIISAYERVPLSITGDGRSTIRELVAKKQKSFQKNGRGTTIKMDDYRIAMNLDKAKLSFSSILPKGQQLQLLNNANLSSGGEAIDMTGKVHPDFERIAINLTKHMGLRLCGVDIMVDGSISKQPVKYWIIEINSSPGLDNYAALGKKQAKIVEDLYLQVLIAMEKDHELLSYHSSVKPSLENII